jgi:hypothetical protein
VRLLKPNRLVRLCFTSLFLLVVSASAHAGYTARGPYTKLRFKFDSGTGKDVAAWWDKTRNSLAGGRKDIQGDS